MKKKIIVLASITITLAYLIALYSMYGFMSSISRYAKELIKDRHEWMLITWLVSVFVTTTYISIKQKKKHATFLFLSGFFLLLILFFTGYYPGYESHYIENIIHVTSVYVAIPCAFTYMVLDGKLNDRLRLVIGLLILFFSFTILALKIPIAYHTSGIEVVALAVIYTYLLK